MGLKIASPVLNMIQSEVHDGKGCNWMVVVVTLEIVVLQLLVRKWKVADMILFGKEGLNSRKSRKIRTSFGPCPSIRPVQVNNMSPAARQTPVHSI